MPPGPLTPTWRLVWKYTVSSFQHKLQTFCDTVPSGDSTGYDLVVRGGGSPVALSTVPDVLWNILKNFWKPADTTFDGVELQSRSGTVWTPVVFVTTTVVPTNTVSFKKATMACIAHKSNGGQNMPAYFYEANFGDAEKYNSYGALDATTKTLVNYFTNAGGSVAANAAYYWRLSRSGGYAGRFLSYVVDTNEKLRRIRRIK